MFLVDAHLDLAMNALEWNRDLRQPVAAIRAREAGLTDKPDRGRGTVSLPELRRGRIGLVVAIGAASMCGFFGARDDHYNDERRRHSHGGRWARDTGATV